MNVKFVVISALFKMNFTYQPRVCNSYLAQKYMSFNDLAAAPVERNNYSFT